MTNIHEIPVQTHTFEPSEHFDALVKAMDAADICALEVGITEMWDVSFPPTLWTAGADNTLGLKFKAPEETDGLGADLFQALGKFSLFPYPLNGLASFPLEKIGGPYRTAWLFGGGLVVTETEISDLFKASRFSNTHLKTLGENFALLVPARDTAHGKMHAVTAASQAADFFSKSILQPQSRGQKTQKSSPWKLIPKL